MPKKLAELGNGLGQRMKELRKHNDFSLADIGTLLGVSRQQVTKYENGESRIAADQLIAIAAHMGVSLSYFDGAMADQPAQARSNGERRSST